MTSTINAFSAGSGGITQAADASGILALQTNSTTAVTIDASQNVGIGTTSPTANLHISSSTTPVALVQSTASATNAAAYIAIKGNSGTSGNYYRSLIGYDASNNIDWAIGNFGTAKDVLAFYGASVTERMRIDSSGNLLVGTTSSGITNSNNLNYRLSPADLNVNHITGTTSGTSYLNFGYAGSVIGSITQSGTTAVLYNLTSDQRLKENIQDAESASALIDSLQVRQFDWKTDNSHQRYGFIAQELVTVAPEAVHQPSDPDEMMAVDYSKLVPMLVKAIQEQQALIVQLQADVAALKGA
jgi:hypothetical protein